MFLENTLTTGENIAIEYELTNNQNDQCDIKKIGDNFEEISNGCSINAFIEIVENSSNYFRIKLTEIYCNNSVPPSIGYMSFSVNNNIMTRTYEKNGVIEESSTYNIFTGNLNTNCFDLSSTTGTTTSTTTTTTTGGGGELLPLQLEEQVIQQRHSTGSGLVIILANYYIYNFESHPLHFLLVIRILKLEQQLTIIQMEILHYTTSSPGTYK